MAQANVELIVLGMTCQGCVRSVEMTLSRLPGVISARVDLESTKAIVEYDDARANPEQMVSTVEEIGYQASKI